MSFVTADEFSVRVTKLLVGLVSHELTTYLSSFNLFKLNELWPYYQKHVNQIFFELHNSLKLSFANIWVWGLRLNFIDCKFFLESNCPDILTLCETNLDDSIDSSNISGRGYLPLIRKDSNTHMHGLTVYVKDGLSFAWDLSLENSADSYLCFWLALFHAVLTSFPYIDHLLHLYARFLILFHLT